MLKVIIVLLVLTDVFLIYCSLIVGKRADEELERMTQGKSEDKFQADDSEDREQK